ncbi:MAG TPA: prolyl oligopeptidase family serine peptidase [Bryobacteraceae bacterium]|nr:prolyl oligopeptidase family serine peptidase [Bryobacteraceae bacterium]
MSEMRRFFVTGLLLVPLSLAVADEPYHKPPSEILRVLDAPTPPEAIVNPGGSAMLLIERILYPPISDLAQPMLRLAGVRINPKNNGPHSTFLYKSLVLQSLNGGTPIRIALPAGAEITSPEWSFDGKHFAFTNVGENSIDLYVGDADSGRIHQVRGIRVNEALGAGGGGFGGGQRTPIQWMPDNRTLLVETVRSDRGMPPQDIAVQPGPHTQETTGKAGPAPTYEDLLKNAHDEDLFDYYATAQLALVDVASSKVMPYGKPGIFTSIEPSPDGQNILVARLHRPYSYFHPLNAFAKEVEVWDHSGKLVYKVASLPVEERVPINGVPTGPRDYHWLPTQPASLYWVEAMDGGNPKETVPHRDRILIAKIAGAGTQPQELMKLEQRFNRIEFGESGTLSLVTDYERKKRWVRTYSIDPEHPGTEPKLIWSRNMQDRYKDPGTPEMRRLANGKLAVRQDGDAIFLRSVGASPKGDRPFLNRFDVKSGETQPLFRCDDAHYEMVEAILDPAGSKLLTRRESPTEPPNYFIREGNGEPHAITHFADPTPELRKLSKQLVTYKRADGVPLSFTLYLPPDYKSGTRLPTVLWAYPYEYNDADTASQITGSTNRFTTLTGASEIFYALHGYAVLDNAGMPVIGSDPTTVNNTYLDQIVMDAKAAIDKAAEMGVTDPNRVGVGGHSYGAFMTANLLAHSSLFKAGVARSGAYNRTLTPFGFQTEERTLWQAPDVYLKMSPFLSADKIKAALLLIHGEADDNTGTFPVQSDRMYAAVRGNGGTVRLVTLPYEAHGYRGRESIEHTLYEMMSWFDRYVKNADTTMSATAAQ